MHFLFKYQHSNNSSEPATHSLTQCSISTAHGWAIIICSSYVVAVAGASASVTFVVVVVVVGVLSFIFIHESEIIACSNDNNNTYAFIHSFLVRICCCSSQWVIQHEYNIRYPVQLYSEKVKQ